MQSEVRKLEITSVEITEAGKFFMNGWVLYKSNEPWKQGTIVSACSLRSRLRKPVTEAEQNDATEETYPGEDTQMCDEWSV